MSNETMEMTWHVVKKLIITAIVLAVLIGFVAGAISIAVLLEVMK